MPLEYYFAGLWKNSNKVACFPFNLVAAGKLQNMELTALQIKCVHRKPPINKW
jgi:hypothetical protein